MAVTDTGGDEPTLPADDATMRGEQSGPHERAGLRRGATVDRYVVLGQLGRGGMGVVYAAYDPELDRRVALKFLHPRAARSGDTDAVVARILREAQAMARLSHPNVVPVHDVGRHQDGIFIAMGLVEGETLKQWLGARQPDVEEIVDVFRDAARGLAAAHGAGIVHRDFKPDNVMVATDGSVAVLDFGLARTRSVDSIDRTSGSWGSSSSLAGRVLETASTQGLAGTPAYMSPEHLRGRGVDERSDQFSFCVALYEALYGQRPFAGTSLAELTGNVCDGTMRPLPKTSRAPRWLHEHVVRGLSPDPDERWPSMPALIDALGSNPAARRRRLALGVAALAGVATLGVGAGLYLDPEPKCTDGVEMIESVWGAMQQQAARDALADDAVYADANTDRVIEELDDYAEAWEAGYRDACVATRELGRQSERLFDVRVACLQRARVELEAVVELLAEADGDVRAQALVGVRGLSPLQRCADGEALLAAVPPPSDPEVREEVDSIRTAVSHAKVATRMGRSEAVLQRLEDLRFRAEQTDYRPVVGEVLTALGDAQTYAGKFREAKPTLTQAVWTSFVAGDRPQAGMAAGLLAYAIGVKGGEIEAGLQWGQRAAEVFEEVTPGSPGHATALTNTGSILRTAGRTQEALELLRRALEMREATPDHPFGLASTLTNLGVVYDELERWTESRDQYQRVIELLEREAGPEHPMIARARANLALPLFKLGDAEGARRQMERALAIAEAAHSPSHPLVIDTLTNFGAMLQDTGSMEESEPYLDRARDLAESSLGEDHPRLGQVHYCLGQLATSRGRLDDALMHHERALQVWRFNFGPNHAHVAEALNSVALSHGKLGRHERAVRYLQEARAVTDISLPPEHSTSTIVLHNLADALSHVERYDEATAAYEEVIAAIVRREGNSGDVGILYAKLGETQLAAGRPSRAVIAMTTGIEIIQDDPKAGAYVPYVRLRRAEAYLRASEHAKALEDARFAHGSWPQEGVPPDMRSTLDFTLARALWDGEPAARAEARRLARVAHDVLPEQSEQRAPIATWLDEHPAP